MCLHSTSINIETLALVFLKHVLLISSPKVYGWANNIPMTLASVNIFKHFLLWNHGPIELNFIWTLLRMGERMFVQMFLVTWPRWPPHPYMVKILYKSSPEPEGWWPWDLVCSIGDVGPTKFVQMMILGWPWLTKGQGQVCILMHLNGKFLEKFIVWKLLKLKSLFSLDMFNLMMQRL